MESFAREMKDVVRTLFPEEKFKYDNDDLDNKRHRSSRTPNSSNRKKKKKQRRTKRRSSISISIINIPETPQSMVVEVRNIAAPMSFPRSTHHNMMISTVDVNNKVHLGSTLDQGSNVNLDSGSSYGYGSFHQKFFSVLGKYPPKTEYLLVQDVDDVFLNNYSNDGWKKDDENDDDTFMLMNDDMSTVRSNNVDDGYDDDDAEMGLEIPVESLSPEQITTLRIMMMPPKRQAVMRRMTNLLLGPSGGSHLHHHGCDDDDRRYYHVSHGPSFWYQVMQRFTSFKKEYASTIELTNRFDMLFGFTWNLAQNPQWMTQHARGWKGEQMISSLALRWRNLLKYHPSQIGILDQDYSLPALICFLDRFKEAVESAEMYGDPKMIFDYK